MSNSAPFFARGGLIAGPGTRTIISVGNTAQRPSVPVAGEIRYNTDISTYEFWFAGNTSWLSPSAGLNQANLNVVALTANTIAVSGTLTSGLIVANQTAISVGNSTSNAVLGQSVLTIGNSTVNSTGFGFGNSTVSMTGNSTSLGLSGVGTSTTMNSSSLSVGGQVINSTGYSGTAATANNASFLGGTAAASYVQTSGLAAYQTTAGLATAVSGLSANNASFLGGVAAANYWKSTGTGALTKLSQLSNDSAYITAASIPTNVSAFVNNVGYITGLSGAVSYNVGSLSAGNTLTAGNYVYSSGNVYAVGDVYCSFSDIKLKKLKSKLSKALDKVDRLNAWYYVRNGIAEDLVPNDGRQRLGLIAQEVEEVLPEAVSFIKDPEHNDTQYLTVNYDMVVPLLVEAIKELRAEVRTLRGE